MLSKRASKRALFLFFRFNSEGPPCCNVPSVGHYTHIAGFLSVESHTAAAGIDKGWESGGQDSDSIENGYICTYS